MGTTAQKLLALASSIEDIREAITEKTNENLTGVPTSQLGNKVRALQTGGATTVINGEYHPNDYNLVSELIDHLPAAYPHCYVVKFAKDQLTTALSGADWYYTSDGSTYTANSTHTWADWYDGKCTRYVIFGFVNKNVNIIFSSIGITNIIELFIDDVIIDLINLTGANSIINRIWGSQKTVIAESSAINFSSSKISYVDLPFIKIGASIFISCTNLISNNFASTKEIGISAFQSSSLRYANLAEGLIKIEGQAFQYCPIVYFKIPSSVTTLGIAILNVNTVLKELIIDANIPISYNSFVSSASYTLTTCIKVKLCQNYNNNASFIYFPNITTNNILTYIIPNLKDNTGQTAKTITFATSVYNALNADGYLPQFTAKNWTVAYA